MCIDMGTYYAAFPHDRLAFKILVHDLSALETFQSILVSDGFDTFATHLHDLDSLNKVRFYWLSAPVLGGIAAATEQLFFAHCPESSLIPLDTYAHCRFCASFLAAGIVTGILVPPANQIPST